MFKHPVLTIETIEASDLTQAQVDFSFVSIQLEIYKPSDSLGFLDWSSTPK